MNFPPFFPQEEWISLTLDTAEGFKPVCDLHVTEPPLTMTLLMDEEVILIAQENGHGQVDHVESPGAEQVQVLVGTKSYFEVLSPDKPPRKILTLPHGSDGAVSAIEVGEHKMQSTLFPTFSQASTNLCSSKMLSL